MDLSLADKTAVICGASQGLGFAAAMELAKEGATVIICSRDRSRIDRAAEKIKQETNRNVHPCQVDLSRTSEIVEFSRAMIDKYRRIDILVNNTGGPPAGFFLDFSEQDWLDAFQNTFLSAMTLTKEILPIMVNNNWGRIINLQSIVVKQPIEDLILSNSIRMAVVGWAKTLANQYARHNITINTIATGFTLTERLQELAKRIAQAENITIEEAHDRWRDKIPARRLAQPGEIASLVAFLASEQAGYITGATIPIDGGWVQSTL